MRLFEPEAMDITASLLMLGCAAIMTACAAIRPPLPPSLNLPKPPTDLRAVRKGDRVNLTWTIPTLTTDRQSVRHAGATSICRGVGPLKECGIPVGNVPAPANPSVPASNHPSAKSSGPASSKNSGKNAAGSYSDTLPAQLQTDAPSATITYAVEALNSEGRGAGLSNQVKVPLIHTPPPPTDFQAKVTAQGVELSWSANPSSNVSATASQPTLHYAYRVYRQQEGSDKRVQIGEVPAGADPHYALTDSTMEWEKTYVYYADTVTIFEGPGQSKLQVEGDDTPGIKIFADDIFPPATPAGLQAVFSGPGQKPFVDLVWTPTSAVDLDGYNVYRHEQGAPPVKINSQLVKTPAYRDTDVAAGKHYFYSVSAVDLRGNESARSEEAGEAIPQ